nr:uncharacterized protein CTRU02_02359 [Colletotrichum truncatum]KAF6798385.1 hypothetical protein CTRU02_02359 [Colletotrichum truncatum]
MNHSSQQTNHHILNIDADPNMNADQFRPMAPRVPHICSCQAADETAEQHRARLRHSIAHRMATMRGDGVMGNYGDLIPVAQGENQGPYQPEDQLKTPYAGDKFVDNRRQAVAANNYGQGTASKGYGISLKKILAAGGYGIAALVQHKSDRNVKTECVMKVERAKHAAHGSLVQEEKALLKYKGAKHILQILDITQEIKAKRDEDNANKYKYKARSSFEEQDKKWDIAKQRARNFILTEYAAHGSLHSWLNKASRSKKPWPNKALWMLFKCLVSGLVGMGYPPKEHHKATHPEWDSNEPIDEYIPRQDLPPQQTVHFDLDPQNILADRDKEHGDFPIFKIADFGNVQFFSEAATNPRHFTKELFWKSRVRGKKWFYMPEQFTRDWDVMGDWGDDGPNKFVALDGSKPRVAGNYGMHSNVYQIGVIMWCAITRCSFNPPVRAIRVNGVDTYGAALQSERFSDIDSQLRDVVQLCMAHEPSQRPNLANLVKRISDRLSSVDLESDEEIMQWARDFFNSPRVDGDEPDVEGDAGQKRGRPPSDLAEDRIRYSPRRRLEQPLAGFPPPLPQQPQMTLDQAARGGGGGGMYEFQTRLDSTAYLEPRPHRQPPREMVFDASRNMEPVGAPRYPASTMGAFPPPNGFAAPPLPDLGYLHTGAHLMQHQHQHQHQQQNQYYHGNDFMAQGYVPQLHFQAQQQLPQQQPPGMWFPGYQQPQQQFDGANLFNHQGFQGQAQQFQQYQPNPPGLNFYPEEGDAENMQFFDPSHHAQPR